MRRLIVWLSLVVPGVAMAGGGATGGSTEYTQILNNIQLANSYFKQVEQLVTAGQQYATMLQNLKDNPLGVVALDTNYLVMSQARILGSARNIGNSMATVDANFARDFNNPQAGNYAEKFKGWTNSSLDAQKAAMLNAGLQRENFATDQAALAALVQKNQVSDGNLGALKTLGEINTAQLQESMKLRDLISSQQLAESNYIASQASKEQAAQDTQTNMWTITDQPFPKPRPKDPKHF